MTDALRSRTHTGMEKIPSETENGMAINETGSGMSFWHVAWDAMLTFLGSLMFWNMKRADLRYDKIMDTFEKMDEKYVDKDSFELFHNYLKDRDNRLDRLEGKIDRLVENAFHESGRK